MVVRCRTAHADAARARRIRLAAGEGRLTAVAGFKDQIEPMTLGNMLPHPCRAGTATTGRS
jgi:hypothetical protein